MSGAPVPADVYVEGKGRIGGRALLDMWVENDSSRLFFIAKDSGEKFTVNKMPKQGKISAIGDNNTKIGTLTKVNESGGLSLK